MTATTNHTARRKRKPVVRKPVEKPMTFEDARAESEYKKGWLYELIGDVLWTGLIVFAWLGVVAVMVLSLGYDVHIVKVEPNSTYSVKK